MGPKGSWAEIPVGAISTASGSLLGGHWVSGFPH